MIIITNYCAPGLVQDLVQSQGQATVRVHHNQKDINEYLEDLIKDSKGVVLTGGNDIDPSFYGEKNTHSSWIHMDRDNFEWDVLKFAEKHKKRVLGICRGHQLMNVYKGGNLYQDIGVAGFPHRGEHFVDLEDIGEIIFNSDQIETNSLHHQAVDILGDGFKPIGVHYVEGLVEAIYNEDLDWLGVQWHPEMMYDERIFKWLTKE